MSFVGRLIAFVDQSDLFGLAFHNGNLAVLHVVAEGEGTANPAIPVAGSSSCLT